MGCCPKARGIRTMQRLPGKAAMSSPLFRTRIKFCGMTRPGDVRLAGELGVDAVGFVFAAPSPRRLEPDQAAAMREALAPMVDAVALFMNNDAEEVRQVVGVVRPSLLQFHGDEDEAFCRMFGLPYIKAVAMGAGASPDPLALHARYPSAAGFLLDAHAPAPDGQHAAEPAAVVPGLAPRAGVAPATVKSRLCRCDVISAIVISGPSGRGWRSPAG